ncbi:MAG TPA: hypothetical protein VHM92_01575 [Allosphingosinicella sp.]|nr:hypothetical protein [Allosphingosinicella sp.]
MIVNIAGLRAAAAAGAIIAAGLAGAAFAHPEHEGDKDKKVTKMVVITEHVREDGKAEGKGERVRTFRIERDGKGATADARIHAFALGDGPALKCDGGEKLVDETAGDDKDKTKIVICSKGATPAQSAERLEQAIAKIQENDEISAEHKAKITAALRAAIDRARAAH